MFIYRFLLFVPYFLCILFYNKLHDALPLLPYSWHYSRLIYTTFNLVGYGINIRVDGVSWGLLLVKYHTHNKHFVDMVQDSLIVPVIKFNRLILKQIKQWKWGRYLVGMLKCLWLNDLKSCSNKIIVCTPELSTYF